MTPNGTSCASVNDSFGNALGFSWPEVMGETDQLSISKTIDI